MSYLSFLTTLIAYGDKIRQHWPLILAFVQAAKALWDAVSAAPVEGTLQLVAETDDELNAEDRLATLIDGDAPSVSMPGRFREVFQLLKALGLLDKLFGKVLGS